MRVQAIAIPRFLEGKDMVVQSRTGSGKTGAFLIPICMGIDVEKECAQALILVPTRELAEQVNAVARDLVKGTGIRHVAVYGGVSYGPQIQAFRERTHLVIATPGRMIDHLMRNRVSLNGLKYLVFDEADEMLSMGFYESMVKILSFVPERRSTTLFSATIPPGVASLAKRFTRDPVHLSLSTDTRHVEEVDHLYYVVDRMRKDRSLLKIIEMENPEAALIFCNTKAEVEYLGKFLQNFGYDADYLSGDLTQKRRDEVMRLIREGKLRFLVATDIAARGIDISELGYVILYDLPQAYEDYIHRAGRTGRAGESGCAISLVSDMEEVDLKLRAQTDNLTLVRRELPGDSEVEAKVAERLRVMLEEKYRSLPNSIRERLERFIPLSKELAGGEEEMHVVAMLFDMFYQDMLHKPLYPRERANVREPRARRSRPGKRSGGSTRSRRSQGQKRKRR
jgi:ATP-dependent RNA helicase DeaD